MTTANEEELLGRLDELAGRVTSTLAGVAPSLVTAVQVLGAGDLAGELQQQVGILPGDLYDPEQAEAARARLVAQSRRGVGHPGYGPRGRRGRLSASTSCAPR